MNEAKYIKITIEFRYYNKPGDDNKQTGWYDTTVTCFPNEVIKTIKDNIQTVFPKRLREKHNMYVDIIDKETGEITGSEKIGVVLRGWVEEYSQSYGTQKLWLEQWITVTEVIERPFEIKVKKE